MSVRSNTVRPFLFLDYYNSVRFNLEPPGACPTLRYYEDYRHKRGATRLPGQVAKCTPIQ